jgi:conjugative transfer region protein TrbK
MSDMKTFRALSLVVSIGVFVVAACMIQLRGGEDVSSPPGAEQTTDVDQSDLARCRAVTPEETASYRHCRQVWAENRRRFFAGKDGAAISHRLDPIAGLTPAPKNQSRMPQGYPSVTSPEASKP